MHRTTMTSLLTGITLLAVSSVQGGSLNFEANPVGLVDISRKIIQNGIDVEFPSPANRHGFASIVSSPCQGAASLTNILQTNDLQTTFSFAGSSEESSFELVSVGGELVVGVNGMRMITLSDLQGLNTKLQLPGFDVSVDADANIELLIEQTGRESIRSVELFSASLGIANVTSKPRGSQTPEPGSLACCLIGLSGLALRRWRHAPEGVGHFANVLQ